MKEKVDKLIENLSDTIISSEIDDRIKNIFIKEFSLFLTDSILRRINFSDENKETAKIINISDVRKDIDFNAIINDRIKDFFVNNKKLNKEMDDFFKKNADKILKGEPYEDD